MLDRVRQIVRRKLVAQFRESRPKARNWRISSALERQIELQQLS